MDNLRHTRKNTFNSVLVVLVFVQRTSLSTILKGGVRLRMRCDKSHDEANVLYTFGRYREENDQELHQEYPKSLSLTRY